MNIFKINEKQVARTTRIIQHQPAGIMVPVNVLEERIKAGPLRYLEYGAYWWAIKKILAKYGYSHGDYYDESVLAQYQESDDLRTIIVADLYKQSYCRHYMQGNHTFTLADGRLYHLFDPDMLR